MTCSRIETVERRTCAQCGHLGVVKSYLPLHLGTVFVKLECRHEQPVEWKLSPLDAKCLREDDGTLRMLTTKQANNMGDLVDLFMRLP